MMRKFIYLTNYSIKKKIKSKSFIITNIVLLVLLLLISNLDTIIKFFGGDFKEDYTIYVVDNTNNSYDIFKEKYEENENKIIDTANNVTIKRTKLPLEEIKEKIKDTNNLIIVFEYADKYKASLISYNYIELTDYQIIYQTLNETKYSVLLNESNIDKEELNRIEENIEVDRVILNEEKSSEEESINAILGLAFSILLLPVFMLIMFLIQIIGGEINEEKTTRSMEIIISNVDAKTHLFSHLIADNVFIIVQSILLGIYGYIGIIVKNTFSGGIQNTINELGERSEFGEVLTVLTNSEVVSKLSYVIPISIILILLSFFAYSLIAAVLASMSTNLEDYQQVQTPIMIILLAGFYLSLMSSLFEGSIFIKTMSFIPLFSCMILPSLLVTDTIGLLESIISIIILIGFDIIVYIFGIRIYKVGILNYSSNKLFKKMIKAIKDR